MAAKPKPIPLHQVKRSMKRYMDTRTASALFDEFVEEVYYCAELTIDEYAQLRDKFKKGGRNAAVLIRLKKV